MLDIKSFSLQEITDMTHSLSLPKFRAKQIFSWLHNKCAEQFSAMSDLPKSVIVSLEAIAQIRSVTIKEKLVSKIDGTTKYLFSLCDGQLVETVLMRYEHGNSVCVSSQVGCKMGCTFCASTKAGFIRSLTPSEILSQVYAVQKDIGERVSNIVLMGIGEPLDNYDSVIRFLELITDPDGLNVSHRHISLSTCGLVDEISSLADEHLQITLSISLHAANDSLRSQTMPVNDRYPIATLIDACKLYIEKTNRRISFEYALISGLNDSPAHARELVSLLRGILCHVNLIPINEIDVADFKKTTKQNALAFQKILVSKGINTTIRRTLGSDINAACGQLRASAQISHPASKEDLS